MKLHIYFSRWRPSAILNYFKVTADHPWSANGGPRSVLEFRLDRIYSFWDIAIFALWGFGLQLPIYMVVSAAHAQNEGLIYFRSIETDLIFWFVLVDLPIHHPTCKGVAGRLGVFTDEATHVKARFEPNFCTVENPPKICFLFWRKWGLNVKKCFRDYQKAHPCAKRCLLTYRWSKSAQRPKR